MGGLSNAMSSIDAGSTPPSPQQAQAASPPPPVASSGPMGGAPASVSLGGAQVPTRPVDQTQQQLAAQTGPTPAQKNLAHSAAVGHGFKSIVNALAGDPNKPVSPTRRMFAGILAGAMTGAAAGAEHPQQGFAGGLARGGAAGVNYAQQQQDRLAKQKQQDIENQRQQSTQDMEKQKTDALVAQYQAQTAEAHQRMDLADKDYHEKHNAASAALYDHLKEAGGVDPVDGKLPNELPASDLVSAYTKDPSIRQAPNGYTRHFIDKTDASELTWNGVHWEHPDGTAADVSDKTTVKVLDVPSANMATRLPTSGKDINAAYGQNIVDPNKTYPMSPLDMLAASTARLKDAKEQATTDLEKKRIGVDATRAASEAKRINHEIDADNYKQYETAQQQVSEQIKTLEDQLKDPENIDPEVRKHVQKQVDDANESLKQIREKIFPGTKIGEALAPLKTGGEQPTSKTNPVAGLKTSTISSTPDQLKPVVNVYLNGGPIGKISVPAPSSYDDFVNNLVRTQEQIPDEAKLSLQDYQAVLAKGKEYFDKLPRAQQSATASSKSESDAKKLAVIKAKNPNLDMSNYSLDDFSSTGVYQPKPGSTRPAY